MWRKTASLNQKQLQETAEFLLSLAQGAFIALLALMLSDEIYMKKVIFAIFIIVLIYYLYTFAMRMLEINRVINDH